MLLLLLLFPVSQKGLCFTISLDPFALNTQLQNSNINKTEFQQTNNVFQLSQKNPFNLASEMRQTPQICTTYWY